jgi:hypothetical protein
MSTGCECVFVQKKVPVTNAGKGTVKRWFYYLGGSNTCESPAEYGPFKTFTAAEQDLAAQHANPGGYAKYCLPGCTHEGEVTRDVDGTVYCAACDKGFPWKQGVTIPLNYGAVDACIPKPYRQYVRINDTEPGYIFVIVKSATKRKVIMTKLTEVFTRKGFVIVMNVESLGTMKLTHKRS